MEPEGLEDAGPGGLATPRKLRTAVHPGPMLTVDAVWPNARRSSGHVPKGRERLIVPGTAERTNQGDDQRRVLERRSRRLVEPPLQPPCAHRSSRDLSCFAISAMSSAPPAG